MFVYSTFLYDAYTTNTQGVAIFREISSVILNDVIRRLIVGHNHG